MDIELLRTLVREMRSGPLLVGGMFVPIDESQREPGRRHEIATFQELIDALRFDLDTLKMANAYLRAQISPIDAQMQSWREGWHGFNFEDACRMDAWDRQRLIEVTAGFQLGDLDGRAYLINNDGALSDPHGHATFCASGDTLVFRVRDSQGYENIYDCKVRRTWHPRIEGCGPENT